MAGSSSGLRGAAEWCVLSYYDQGQGWQGAVAVLQEEGVIIQHWPQYVEVGHERAWELLEWDVRNRLAFFWRRYGVEQGLDEKMK